MQSWLTIKGYLASHDPVFQNWHDWLPITFLAISYHKNHNTVAVGGHPHLHPTHYLVLLSHCSAVPVSQCHSVPMSMCPGVPMFRCQNVPLSHCLGVPVSRCSGVPLSWCPIVPVSRCPSVPESQYPGGPVTLGVREAHKSGGTEKRTRGGGTEKSTILGVTSCTWRSHRSSYRGGAHLRIINIC